jgi:hypothetical protein
MGYWELVEPVWETISIYDGPAVYLDGMRAVPEYVGLLFGAHWAYHETGNGGFSQFFRNSTGIVAPEAVRGFRAIGQSSTADVLERAMRQFGRVYPRDREERQALMNTGDDPNTYVPDRSFDALDEQMWPLIEEESGGFEAAADRFAAQLEDRHD